MLFEGVSLKKTSQEVNVHVNTLENWKRKPEFQQAMTEYSIKALSRMLPKAIKELDNLIEHGRSEMVKLQAVQTIINNANQLVNGERELNEAKIEKIQAETKLLNTKQALLGNAQENTEKQLGSILDAITKSVDEEHKNE